MLTDDYNDDADNDDVGDDTNNVNCHISSELLKN